jgi:hypothetical protein
MTKLCVALAMTLALAAGAKDVTGTWNIALQGPDHVIPVGMELKQDGKTVTGTILLPTSRTDRTEVALTGQLVDGALKLTGAADAKAHVGELTIEATLDEDGTLAGTISMGEHGTMKWIAERLKAKK